MLQKWEFYKQSFADTFGNLDKMGKLIGKYNLLKVDPKEIENSVFIKAIVFVLKILPIKKTLDPHGFISEFSQISKE